MARNRIGLNVDDLDIYLQIFEQYGKNIKEFTEEALIKSKDLVNTKLEKDTTASNYPAKGKYESKSQILKNSIDNDYSVVWAGDEAEIKIGYDFKKSGLVSIFNMYGTPNMKPAKKIKNDIYGPKTMKEVKELQNELIKEFLGLDSFFF